MAVIQVYELEGDEKVFINYSYDTFLGLITSVERDEDEKLDEDGQLGENDVKDKI